MKNDMTDTKTAEERAQELVFDMPIGLTESKERAKQAIIKALTAHAEAVEKKGYRRGLRDEREKAIYDMCDVCRGDKPSHEIGSYWDAKKKKYWHRGTKPKYPHYFCRASAIRNRATNERRINELHNKWSPV